MKRDLDELDSRRFDVLVVGGGITGAWIALDCAARGLDVALIDKGDFGSGTSAKSSKVIHGGIRYLQQLRIDKVRESAVERACYHRAAPHLTNFLPFVVPTYGHGMKGRGFMRAGLGLYRLLCLGEDRLAGDAAKAMPPSYFLTREQVLEMCPIADPGLTGAMVYCESHMQSSERMTLAVLDTAVRRGALCANYLAAEEFIAERGKKVSGAMVRDEESGDRFRISARLVVNAAGPWIPALNRTLSEGRAQVASTGFSQGSHLVTRQLISGFALALPTRFAGQNVIDRGGRHIFILPWRDCSLIGTSYVAARGDIDDPVLQREEIAQLVDEVNTQLPGLRLIREDIRHAFTGIYPLDEEEIREHTYQGTGDYQIVDHAAAGHEGLVSALGAKYTTARLVAEKVTALAEKKLRKGTRACNTRSIRLAAAGYTDLDSYRADVARRLDAHFADRQADRLVGLYGTDVETLIEYLESDAGMAETLCSTRPNVVAEIVHAVESEMAIHLDDVVYRRTGLGTIGYPGDACIGRCADIMAGLLSWDDNRRAREIRRLDRYRRHEALL